MTANRPNSSAQKSEILAMFASLPHLLKPSQAAAALGVGVRTLELWRQTGDGPRFVKMGPKLIRYLEEDVAAFLSGATRASTSDR